MKLRVVAVGRDRSGLYAPAVEEYAKRIGRYVRFEMTEVPEARKHAGTPRAREEEGEAILARVGERDRLVALDERGEEETSAELSRRVGRWLAGGQDVVLVVGGADGLAPAVRARAAETLALSRLTLAHRLARLVLVEQLYRALTILRGEPYHR
ncbi:MAG TPA: 23S rRNA (pseudouridine(1915)-N(3))-methyltransferase RlmH [Anaeromyxobacter sp.]